MKSVWHLVNKVSFRWNQIWIDSNDLWFFQSKVYRWQLYFDLSWHFAQDTLHFWTYVLDQNSVETNNFWSKCLIVLFKYTKNSQSINCFQKMTRKRKPTSMSNKYLTNYKIHIFWKRRLGLGICTHFCHIFPVAILQVRHLRIEILPSSILYSSIKSICGFGM